MLSESRPARVGKWTESALRVLRERYLTRKDGEVTETPEEMCWRVAQSIAAGEARYGRSPAAVREVAEAFYDMMVDGSFLPNSPTLMNAGKGNGLQYSACYVLPVGDSMEEIFDSVKAAAIIHKCLVGDTWVMSNGLTRLREVRDGALVMTDEGPFFAAALHDNGDQPVFEVQTNRGYKIVGTAEHRMLVIASDGSYQWRKIGELREADWLVMQPGSWIGGETKLSEFEFLQKPGRNRTTFKAREYRLPRELTPTLAELIGLYIGDGSNHRDGIRITVSKECPEVVRRIEDASLALFDKRPSIRLERGKSTFEVALLSTQIKGWFDFLGVTKKSVREARIPEIVLRSTEEAACAFVRGLFTADGCVRKNGHITLTTISSRLAEELQNLLMAVGVPTHLRKDVWASGYEVNQVSVCTKGGFRTFREKIGFIGARKAARLAAVDEDTIFVKGETIPAKDNFFFVRVTAIRPAGIRRVYDLTVPEKHAYVANGFVAHNSGGGTGFAFSRLRPKDDLVASTGGRASGPVSFLRVFNSATEAVKQGGCVAPETRVSTSRGILQIRDLGPSDAGSDTWHPHRSPLLVATDEGPQVSDEFYNHGVAPVRCIRTRHGYALCATLEHRVRVIADDGEYVWKRMEDIKVGDWVALQKKTYLPVAGFKFPAVELRRHPNATPVRIPETASAELGEFIGYFLGDGAVSVNRRGTGRLILTVCQAEPDVAEHLTDIVDRLFGLRAARQTKAGEGSDNHFFNSTTLVAWLKGIGVDKRSASEVRLPDIAFSAGPDFARGLLRGLFTADGTVSKDGYPSLSSVSKELVEGVQPLLLALGVPSRISVVAARAGAFGERPLYRLRVVTADGLRVFSRDIGFFSSKKGERLARGLSKAWELNDVIPFQAALLRSLYGGPGRGSGPGRRSRGANRTLYRALQHYLPGVAAPRHLTRSRLGRLIEKHPSLRDNPTVAWFLTNDQFYDEITKIEEGESLTLDLSVPTNNTYIANGFVSHNTRRGANMGILRVDHPDILEFIECKLDGGITNFNISVAATNSFMDALSTGEDYDLINPHTGKVTGRLSAREVFQRIVRAAWRTGDPGMVFIDRINASPANPTPEIGTIEATNPCGEQPLLPNEACFAPETRITTDRGLENVAELYARQERGEPVLVATNLNGRGRHVIFRPATVVKVGVKPTVRVTLTNGQQIRVTPDHQILTNAGWKAAGTLRREDRVLIQTAMAGPLAITSTDGDLHRMFGWFTGDGWFTKAVGLTFGPDDELAFDRLVPVWRQFTGSAARVQTQATRVRCISTERAEAIAAFEAYGFVAAHGPHKRVPKRMFTAQKEEQVRYLQGLFCADGSKTHRKPQVTLSSASLELLRDAQLLLLNLGMRSNIKYYPHRPTGRAWGQLKVNGESYHRFQDLIGFPLTPRKQERCEKFPWQRTKQDRLAIPVASVVSDENVEVYDISEPVTHSLIAEGMIVHNCNLGSLNVSKFARRIQDGEWSIDWEDMERVIRLAVRFLDDVIEMNPYPLPEIDATVKSNRRIGLGIMGWADLLFILGVPYDSPQATELAERLMAFVKDKGHDQSARLAEERGPFPNWNHSIYQLGRPMRNSTVTTIAPTGTISMIAGCSSGVEPIFALAFEHRVRQSDGERVLTFVNETFERIAREQGWFSDALMHEIARQGSLHDIPGVPEAAQQVFKTSHEIPYEWHVRHQAAFQRSTDNGVSKTINLPNQATEEDVASAYRLAWELGCLGITVFRDGCKGEQVLNVGIAAKKDKTSGPAPAVGPATIKPRPHSLHGRTYRTETPIGTAFITVNETGDREPFEVFVQVGKAGSDTMAVAEALGRLISLVLRLPSPFSAQRRLEEIISQLSRIGGGQPTGFGPAKILSLPDAIARTLAEHIGQVKPADDATGAGDGRKTIGDLCKECGQATFIYEEGCKKCLSCGYNEC
jgi:ribonucleoside-diphosphate reductase alpha chain